MAGIRQHSTGPELAVRKILSALGVRYRVSNRSLPGSPDIANRRRKWAIFVHGCYWHRHQNCPRSTTPTNNRQLWLDKFAANVMRDRVKKGELQQMGYTVLTIWECQVEDRSRLTRILSRVASMRRP